MSLEDDQKIRRQRRTALSITHLTEYDNSKILVLGTTHLPINVGPINKNVEFQALNILAIYLQPTFWKAMPSQPSGSSLHFTLKSEDVIKCEVVTIKGDNLCATITSRGQY